MSKIVMFKITGLSPLLTNNPSSMRRRDNALAVRTIPTAEEEAEAGLYKNEQGFYILSEAFRSAMVGRGGGATGQRIGKFSASSRLCAGCFTIEPYATLLSPKTMKPLTTYEIDTRRAVIQNQGILRSRPMFRNWAVRLPLEIDTQFVTIEHVLEILNLSGKIAGVGDFRPQRRGPFGRFRAEVEKKK